MKNKILIIDGDLGILDALERVLASEGFVPRCIDRPDFIYEQIDNFTPDLIIMEIVHASVDGRVLCNEIKAKSGYRKIPIILLTSLTHQEIAKLDCYADAILGKPYSLNKLLIVVKCLIKIV